jgi:hypothetical protein
MPDERNSNPDKSSKEQYKRHVDGSIRVSGQIEVHPPPDSTKEETPEQKKARSYRFGNFVISVLTLIGVVIYAALTYWLGHMTRESINNNSKQFQIDQRPYLWTTNTIPQITITEGQKMWANIELADFGKAPALKVRVGGVIFVGPNAKQDTDVWFNGLADKLFTDPDQSEIVVPPGIPSVFQNEPKPIPVKPINAKRESRPEPAPSGGFVGGGYVTIMSIKALTQPDVDYILDHDESAIIAMRLQYFDAFGNRYWSNVCLSRFTTGAIPSCPHHNEIH